MKKLRELLFENSESTLIKGIIKILEEESTSFTDIEDNYFCGVDENDFELIAKKILKLIEKK